jgi:RNA polymerase sigma factor (TIGR02999 family)
MSSQAGATVADESITVTQLLKAWSGGDTAALDQLTPRVYTELRRMAGMYLRREAGGNTLQATALVHEVFLRMVEIDSVDWQDRAHFFAVAATMMRRLLVDQARARGTAKRGEAAPHVNLEEALEIGADADDRGIAAIDEALKGTRRRRSA